MGLRLLVVGGGQEQLDDSWKKLTVGSKIWDGDDADESAMAVCAYQSD